MHAACNVYMQTTYTLLYGAVVTKPKNKRCLVLLWNGNFQKTKVKGTFSIKILPMNHKLATFKLSDQYLPFTKRQDLRSCIPLSLQSKRIHHAVWCRVYAWPSVHTLGFPLRSVICCCEGFYLHIISSCVLSLLTVHCWCIYTELLPVRYQMQLKRWLLLEKFKKPV